MLQIKPRRVAACLIFASLTLITGVYLTERWDDLRNPPIKSPSEHMAEGGRFCYSVAYFDEAADAARRIRGDLDYAAKYASKAKVSPKFNWLGAKVGERILTVHPARENHKPWVSIQWTNGARLHRVCASDLRLALGYEREANRWFSRFPGWF